MREQLKCAHGACYEPLRPERGFRQGDFSSLRSGDFYHELDVNKKIELLLDSPSLTLGPGFISGSKGMCLPRDRKCQLYRSGHPFTFPVSP